MGFDVRKLAAAAVVAVLALTGCANSPSVAARVGELTITEAQVTESAEAVVDIYEQQIATQGLDLDIDEGMARKTAFALLWFGTLSEALAADTGESVTQGERDARLEVPSAATQLLADLSADERTSGLVDGYLNFGILAERTEPENLFDWLNGLDVTVNPRHGVWDPALDITPTGTGSMSKPVEGFPTP